MHAYFMLMLLLMGSWTQTGEQGNSLDTICKGSIVSATNRPPIDTHTIHFTNKALFLTYHHLDEQESFITITPAKFKQHLQLLKEKHYNVISMEDYVCFHKRRQTLPPNAVVITFDDGYRSFYDHAYPLLKQQGYPATNFVILSDIETENPSLPFLTWKQIREMKREGYSFYSHSYDLHQKRRDDLGNWVPPMTNRIYLSREKRMETEEEWKARVRQDLKLGEAMLKMELDNPFSLLCFPMGEYNQTVIDESKQLGFSLFFTTKEGINNGSSDEIARISAGMPYVSADILQKKLQQYDQE
jgi:peptidoglycan/xylan/chitin deacetylase (PgdA/CDA1 family)